MKLLIIFILFFSTAAYAEVSDKMPSVTHLWLQSIAGFVISLILTRLFVWFVTLAGLIAVLFGVMSCQTFLDPFMGPAILNEQGMLYVMSSFSSSVFIVLGAIAGLILNRQRKKHGSR